MNLNWHHIKGGFSQASLLAGPCAILSAVLTAVITQAIWPGWRQPVLYYVFGGILSATDPVSVVALLKSCGASSKLTIVIVGESLLNDGTAMILFFYFTGILGGTQYTAASFLEFISFKLLLSPLCGLIIGAVAVVLMKRLYQKWHVVDMNLQVGITLLATYSSFFVAQWPTLIDGSGVLSCCSAGLVMAWMASPKVLADHYMHEIWGKLEWSCNTLIFLLGGLVAGGRTIQSASLTQLGTAILLYIALMLIRVIIILCVYPVLSKIGVKCSRNDAVFMAFSGLRGALAVALALELKENTNVVENDADEFYFFVCVIAALTLLLNGTAAESVLQYLGLVEDPSKPETEEMKFVLHQIRMRIRRTVRDEIEQMRAELGTFDKDEVRRLCTLLRGSMPDDEEYRVMYRDGSKIDPMLLGYVRSTFLETVKCRYWDAINSAKLGTQSHSAQLLLYSIDKGMDLVNDPKATLGDWESLERNLKASSKLLKVATFFDKLSAKFRYYPGWVSWIDALTERRAIYVLTNFIDAHTYAQGQIHMFLGAPDKDFGQPWPEEQCVLDDSRSAVKRAKQLLGTISSDDITEFFNHRTARIVLIMQRQLVESMVEEGALNPKLASYFLKDIDNDADKIEVERESTHRRILDNNLKKKMSVAREIRESSVGDSNRSSFISMSEFNGRDSSSSNSAFNASASPSAINVSRGAVVNPINQPEISTAASNSSSAPMSMSPPRPSATFREVLASPTSGNPSIVVNEMFVTNSEPEFGVARLK
jgi:NhaP-type Na+/H+ or K+/H+ antiporter